MKSYEFYYSSSSNSYFSYEINLNPFDVVMPNIVSQVYGCRAINLFYASPTASMKINVTMIPIMRIKSLFLNVHSTRTITSNLLKTIQTLFRYEKHLQ